MSLLVDTRIAGVGKSICKGGDFAEAYHLKREYGAGDDEQSAQIHSRPRDCH